MRKFLLLYGLMTLILCTSCGERTIVVEQQLNEDVAIYPDYKEVTIPSNIAPLNFSPLELGDAQLIAEGENGEGFQVQLTKGFFDIPPKKWGKLLDKNKGGKIKLTVCKSVDGKWCALIPFYIYIAQEPIDKYIAYRLIPPDYELWNKMGIYQRNLESFEESAIYENTIGDYNCANCHSFQNGDPKQFMFHTRETHPGTLVFKNGQIEKLNTKTDQTISFLVYPYWHPDGKYIVFSVNSTRQAFHANNLNRVEVYDSASDVVVYDTEKHQVISCDLLKADSVFETFPSFSADGKSIYFCSAKAVNPMPFEYRKVHYDLCRIEFNAETGTFGNKVDTLYHASPIGKSVSLPRESPDGKYMTFVLHQYGNFSIWHKDADLYTIDLNSGEVFPLEDANSDNVESYHSWSRNSKWMVFSSRRDDGLYTRPYICYIDDGGKAHKSFMLPQRNPKKYYQDLLLSYNIPEFITDKVIVSQKAIEKMLKDEPGHSVSYATGSTK
ncbi:MAG: PD40 domain-containing protein [Bacteroidaceae bacterium]|nr:PD40 domain-containing protein [Bacteroidaceae bacterium]